MNNWMINGHYHYTSDLGDEYDEDYYHDIYFDYRLGCYYDLDIGKNHDKLVKFNGPNSHKKFDPDTAHPDVAYNISWHDPIHDFCNNKDYKNKAKQVVGLINKFSGKPVSVAIYALKNHVLYRKHHTFRSIADGYIKSLLRPDRDDSYLDSYRSWKDDVVIKDGIIC